MASFSVKISEKKQIKAKVSRMFFLCKKCWGKRCPD